MYTARARQATNIALVGKTQLYFHALNLSQNVDLHIKLEGLNPAGSIKIKTAWYLIKGLEDRGEIQPGKSTVIESSSGNLGVALAMVCNQRGYRFICVVDPLTTPHSKRMIQLYGGELEMVTHKDKQLGYLPTRIQRVQELTAEIEGAVWTNQYASSDNLKAHYETTAPEIHSEFPELDLLFIGASTTGTLAGCCTYFRQHSPGTKIIAVEPEGSVTFGGMPKLRRLPGLGTGKRPPLADKCDFDDLIYIDERDTIRTCRRLRDTYSLLLGASSGTVIAAVLRYTQDLGGLVKVPTAVAISPDMGDKYLDTVYNDEWIKEHYSMVTE